MYSSLCEAEEVLVCLGSTLDGEVILMGTIDSLPLQHPCTSQCHAPSICPEDEPCKTIITLRCECGRLTQPASCGASSSNPSSRGHGPFQLKCNQECAMAKRNRNLADALGITTDMNGGGKSTKFPVTWPEEIVRGFRANSAFGLLVEKTFNE